MNPTKVLVVGGGVAGSACAIQLRTHHLDVTLVEKSNFPRDKVCGCCIGGAGIKMLENLSCHASLLNRATNASTVDQPLLQQIMAQAVQVKRWRGSLGGRTIQVDLPSGIAISRSALDSTLLKTVRDAGCNVQMPCNARITDVASKHVKVTLQHPTRSEQREFDLVVLATGLNSQGLSSWLPWRESPHGPFGVSWTAHCDEITPHVIHMACDHDGYVGLIRLESGQVDVAAALRSGSAAAQRGSPSQRVQQILNRSSFPDFRWGPPSKVMTTPPLRRSRVAGKGRLLTVGDASGYVEPFTGEGMTWGLQSGIALANLIGSYMKPTRQDPCSTIGEQWDSDQQKLLRRKKRTCRIVTNALRSPWARKTIGTALASFPKLATPLIRQLG